MKSSSFAGVAAAFFVVFALVMQMIPIRAQDDRARSLEDLSGALGQPGFICTHHADGSAPAQHPDGGGDPCRTCPFCAFAQHSNAILPVCARVAVRTNVAFPWLFPAWHAVSSRRIPLRGLSRAPPSLA